MRLAIADPPYPPFFGSGGKKNRASRWYGNNQRSKKDRPADIHPDAAHWDEISTHRNLIERLHREFDGFAIATSPDGLGAYYPIPVSCRIMAWVRPNACPGAHRIRNLWEAVIVHAPTGRRSNRCGAGSVPDVLTCNVPRGFRGKKPAEWTRWVLSAMSFDEKIDQVFDLFAGSGEVTREIYRMSTVPSAGDKR